MSARNATHNHIDLAKILQNSKFRRGEAFRNEGTIPNWFVPR